jgi:peptide chain release factor 1
MSLEHKLDGLLAKHDELQNLLAHQSGMGSQEFARLSKEFTELNEIVRIVKIYRKVESEIRDLNLLLDEDISDSEVKALAEEELRELKQQLPSLKHDVQLQLLPKDSVDKKNAILEIRAGTGGEEAALFAANLFRMYQRFSEQHNWTFDFMDLSETGIGGFFTTGTCPNFKYSIFFIHAIFWQKLELNIMFQGRELLFKFSQFFFCKRFYLAIGNIFIKE